MRPVKSDVVDEDDGAALQIERELRRRDVREAVAQVQVVAVHGDIDNADCRLRLLDLPDESGEAPGDLDAARRDADQRDAAEVGIPLDDFVRDARSARSIARRIKHEAGRVGEGGVGM